METIDTIEQKSQELVEAIKASTQPSREQSLALTNLEQAIMWAEKAPLKQEQTEV